MRVHLQKGILTNVKLLICLKYEIKALKSKRIITSRSISFQLEHQKLYSKLFQSLPLLLLLLLRSYRSSIRMGKGFIVLIGGTIVKAPEPNLHFHLP